MFKAFVQEAPMATVNAWETLPSHAPVVAPEDNPIFSRQAGVAGWKYFVQHSLKNYLERRDR